MSTRQENKDRGPKTEGNTQKARDREEQETEGNMQNGKGRGAETEAAFFISGCARRVAMAFRKTDEHKTREQRPKSNKQRPKANNERPTTNDQTKRTTDERPMAKGQRRKTKDQRPRANEQRCGPRSVLSEHLLRPPCKHGRIVNKTLKIGRIVEE